jgi:hypothetical protein
MAVPYDLFLRFLATKNVVDLRDVNAALADLNLPEVRQAVFDVQYRQVSSTVPKGVLAQIENQSYSVDFMKWMRVLEVDALWAYEKAFRDPVKRPVVKLTYDIHQDLQIRLVINALLIKGVPPADLLNSIRSRFASMLKEEHVALYRNFFFNPARMSRGDWKNYLAWLEPHEQHLYFLALTEGIDVVKTELELPAKVSVSDMLQHLLSKTFQKAKTYLALSTKESNEEARRFITLTVELADKYEKYRSGDSTDFGNALQMEFEFVDTDFPTPDGETLARLQAEIKAKEAKSKDKDMDAMGFSGSPEGEPETPQNAPATPV